MKNCFGGTLLDDVLYFPSKLVLEYDGLPCMHKFKSEIQTGSRNGKYACVAKKIWRSLLL